MTPLEMFAAALGKFGYFSGRISVIPDGSVILTTRVGEKFRDKELAITVNTNGKGYCAFATNLSKALYLKTPIDWEHTATAEESVNRIVEFLETA